MIDTGKIMAEEVHQTARTWNFDAYLAATLAPSSARHDLITIAAFVGELERVRHTISEPALAQIRIQWWRDELQRMASGGTSEHPVGLALTATIGRHGLPVALLLGIADAVFDRVSGAQYPDEHALNTWTTKRYAAAFELALRCLIAHLSTARTVIDNAGNAYGRARLLHEMAGDPALCAVLSIQRQRESLIEQVETARRNVTASTKQWPRHQRAAILPVVLVPDYIIAPGGTDAQQPTPFQKVRRMAWAHWVTGL